MDDDPFGRATGASAPRAGPDGPTMADVLELPDPERALVTWLMRQHAVALPQALAQLGGDDASTRATVADLCARGFLRETTDAGTTSYHVPVAQRRKPTTSSERWRALEGLGE